MRVDGCAASRGRRGTIIPGLLRRIPSELRSYAPMGENSTTLGDQVGSPRVVPILRPASYFSFCPFHFTFDSALHSSFVIGNTEVWLQGAGHVIGDNISCADLLPPNRVCCSHSHTTSNQGKQNRAHLCWEQMMTSVYKLTSMSNQKKNPLCLLRSTLYDEHESLANPKRNLVITCVVYYSIV